MLSPSALWLDLLPPATAAVLAKLAQEPVLSGFCLVGGTALAPQAGHRRSLDLDLVRFSPTLDKQALFRAMRAQGAELITPQSAISAARINGLDLLARAQDYVLEGVKVQCFTYPEGLRHSPGNKPGRKAQSIRGSYPLTVQADGLEPSSVSRVLHGDKHATIRFWWPHRHPSGGSALSGWL